MLTRFACFLLLFTGVFLAISHLFDLLVTLWIDARWAAPFAQKYDTSFAIRNSELDEDLSTQTQNAQNVIEQLKLILAMRGIYQVLGNHHHNHSSRNIEKQDGEKERERLLELVQTSGRITRDELFAFNRRRSSKSAANNDNNCDNNRARRSSNIVTTVKCENNNLDENNWNDDEEEEADVDEDERNFQIKHFSSAKLMEEEMDDDDDHVWLLYVRPVTPKMAVDRTWRHLMRRFDRLDLRFARFDCASNRAYCEQRRWHVAPHLVLVFPRAANSKPENAPKIVHTFRFESNADDDLDAATEWLRQRLTGELFQIAEADELEHDWLDFPPPRQNDEIIDHKKMKSIKRKSTNTTLVKMIAIMGEQFRHSSPLILGLLAIRFRERIKFAIHYASNDLLERMHSRYETNIADRRLPIYLLISPQQQQQQQQNLPESQSSSHFVVYDRARLDEPLRYANVDLYLRGFTPQSSDVYVALLSLLNLAAALNVFWTRCGSARQRFRLSAIRFVEMNFAFAISGSIAGSLLRHRLFIGGKQFVCDLLPTCRTFAIIAHEYCHHYWSRYLWSSDFAFFVRAQLLSPYGFERLTATFLIVGAILVLVRRRRLLGNWYPDYDDRHEIDSVFRWIAAIACGVNFVLFRRDRRTRRRVPVTPNAGANGVNNHFLSSSASSSSSSSLPSQSSILESFDTENREALTAQNRSIEYDEEDDEEEDDEDDEYELNDEQQHIDLDNDLDRLLLERIFAMPNLWLQPELISMDYIHQLPIWQHKPMEINSSAAAETSYHSSSISSSSSSSSSTDSSDSEDSSAAAAAVGVEGKRKHFKHPPLEAANICANVTTLLCYENESPFSFSSSSSISKKSECDRNTKEANFNAINNASCAKHTNKSQTETTIGEQQQQSTLSPQLRATLERKRSKFFRIRQKRNRRNKMHPTIGGVNETNLDPPSQSLKLDRTKNANLGACCCESNKNDSQSNNLDRPKWMLDMFDCTICLDAYQARQSICGLPCGHNYHHDCIGQWLTRGNHCCPICRWPSYRLKHPRQSAK